MKHRATVISLEVDPVVAVPRALNEQALGTIALLPSFIKDFKAQCAQNDLVVGGFAPDRPALPPRSLLT